jgi:SAM-dependent methyltransferase
MLRGIARTFTSEIFRWRAHVIKATFDGLRRRANPVARNCPICGYKGFFRPFGWPVRPEANCPGCGSLERHRLFKLWFNRNSDFLKDKRILHFAPEKALGPILRECASAYTTADLGDGADLRLNIESMDVPDASFDIVVCSHVLEHVNDSKALSELHRVLVDDGIALLMMPICEGLPNTYEVPSILDEKERELHFGQYDHVRWFGSDIRARIVKAGFSLEEFTSTGELAVAYGLQLGEKLFVARKHRT